MQPDEHETTITRGQVEPNSEMVSRNVDLNDGEFIEGQKLAKTIKSSQKSLDKAKDVQNSKIIAGPNSDNSNLLNVKDEVEIFYKDDNSVDNDSEEHRENARQVESDLKNMDMLSNQLHSGNDNFADVI